MLRQGRTGLGDDDFMLVEGSEDDNEKWAGAKVLGVMKSLAVLDAVVIVSRWYAIPSYFSVYLSLLPLHGQKLIVKHRVTQ